MLPIRTFYIQLHFKLSFWNFRAENEMFPILDSWKGNVSFLPLILGWNLLILSKKVCSLFSPWVVIRKVIHLSIYLSHKNGWWSVVSRGSRSNSSIKMHAYVGAHFVPIAALEICCLVLRLNSKKLLFKTNSAMFKRSPVGNFFVLVYQGHAEVLWTPCHVEY